MVIDIHAHFAPPEWIDELRRNGTKYGCAVHEDAPGALSLRIGDAKPAAILPSLSDMRVRLETMAQRGLDRQVLSPSMGLVGYHLPASQGQNLSRLYNEAVVASAKKIDGRLIPAATVPMQSSRAAVEELDYAVKNLDIRMVEIGTNINGANLDEESFEPFFSRAADLAVLVQLHPHQDCVAGVDRLGRYFLSNLIGNPTDSAIAGASLIFGGVLERLPALNVCLVHGGGSLPYLLGRLDYGYSAIKVAHTISESPQKYFRRLYFDTLVHDPRALRFLHELAGPDRLMVGTDYPYDNTGDKDPLGALDRAGLSGCQSILGGNAAKLLGLTS